MLKEGDKNTKFFHASKIHKREANKIEKIKNERREWLLSREAIGNEICRILSSIWDFSYNKRS